MSITDVTPPLRVKGAKRVIGVAAIEHQLTRQAGLADVEIDLRGVGLLGAEAVAVLLCAHFKLHQQGRRLRVSGCPPQAERYLRTCGFFDLPPTPASQEAA
ncbi:STAS domain-containing protein [Actinoplanes oblitus]|uniref:STAS domain-containing protein n=1 Tax=Actinoplanes oblitus TaxID=3040509 RepID=A0ABY8W6L6_9ACTN|nr:STAS domain-containing protein [Actinoplanes oblitus]WIM92987.1 STAS domain-containing protein [Actinoplanes oblitus]